MWDLAASRPNTGFGVGPVSCKKTTISKRTASVKPRAQLKTRSIIMLPPGRLWRASCQKNATIGIGSNTGMVNATIVFVDEFDAAVPENGSRKLKVRARCLLRAQPESAGRSVGRAAAG